MNEENVSSPCAIDLVRDYCNTDDTNATILKKIMKEMEQLCCTNITGRSFT